MKMQVGVKFPLNIADDSWKKLLEPDPPNLLYHYTNVAGASGIVTSKSLWMSKIQYLNDFRELHHAVDRFKTTVSIISPQLTNADHIDLVNEAADRLDSFLSINICVASFCEEGDLLSQWRGYADAGGGISLGFRVREMKDTGKDQNISLKRCIYDEAEQDQVIQGAISNLISSHDRLSGDKEKLSGRAKHDLITCMTSEFFHIAPMLKDPGFSEEKEWRLVTTPKDYLEENFKIRQTENKLVPYYNFVFHPDKNEKYTFIRRCYIGPTVDAHLTQDAFMMLVQKNSIQSFSTQSSSLPYRRR